MLPLQRLGPGDRAALLEEVQKYWPDLLTSWQDQIARRAPAADQSAGRTPATERPEPPRPVAAAEPGMDPALARSMRRRMHAGEVLECARDSKRLFRILGHFGVVAAVSIFFLVSWQGSGAAYDLAVGVVFALWALFILVPLWRRRIYARVDAQGISINAPWRWHVVPYDAMQWYDFDSGQRIGLIAYRDGPSGRERCTGFAKQVIGAEFTETMRQAIGAMRARCSEQKAGGGAGPGVIARVPPAEGPALRIFGNRLDNHGQCSTCLASKRFVLVRGRCGSERSATD